MVTKHLSVSLFLSAIHSARLSFAQIYFNQKNYQIFSSFTYQMNWAIGSTI